MRETETYVYLKLFPFCFSSIFLSIINLDTGYQDCREETKPKHSIESRQQ